jgi:hypothetical protein
MKAGKIHFHSNIFSSHLCKSNFYWKIHSKKKKNEKKKSFWKWKSTFLKWFFLCLVYACVLVIRNLINRKL